MRLPWGFRGAHVCFFLSLSLSSVARPTARVSKVKPIRIRTRSSGERRPRRRSVVIHISCARQVFSAALRGEGPPPPLRTASDNPRSMAWHCNGTTNQEMVTKLKGKWPPSRPPATSRGGLTPLGGFDYRFEINVAHHLARVVQTSCGNLGTDYSQMLVYWRRTGRRQPCSPLTGPNTATSRTLTSTVPGESATTWPSARRIW